MNAFTVALTGGIASGKSTVEKLFARQGVPVIDADVIARELVAPGSMALAEIAAAFGHDALLADGTLDRKSMRARVFSDINARRTLEAILHPRVRDALAEGARTCTAPYCLLAIPLLAESGGAYAWVDRVVVVDVPRALQIERLAQRDGMTRTDAECALSAQATRETRLALADDVIDNTATTDALLPVVERLHALFWTLKTA